MKCGRLVFLICTRFSKANIYSALLINNDKKKTNLIRITFDFVYIDECGRKRWDSYNGKTKDPVKYYTKVIDLYNFCQIHEEIQSLSSRSVTSSSKIFEKRERKMKAFHEVAVGVEVNMGEPWHGNL